jgi:hypothetical protein
MSRVEWRDGAAMTGTRQPYPIVAKLPVVITNQMIEVDRRMIEDIGINHLSDDGKCRFAIGQCRARSVAGERSLEQTNLMDAIREVRIHVTEAVGQVCPGKGEPRPSPD